MIPIRLTIKGLYSYREQVEIDFEKLAEGHLFGIFGAVGSGKSAILEAITFALYGKTERLNSSGDNRNYNMMNLQSQDLLIELEFKTMVEGKAERYLFRVRQSRNSKKFEDVRTPARTALHWKDNDWETLPTTDAAGILNLSYDNFIKTIIIPQGKFQDFLHMGATDRTRMLREIFALDRFELDRPTKVLIGETRELMVRLEEQLMPLSEANAAEIAAKEGENLALEATLGQAKLEAHRLQLVATQLRQLKELSEKMAVARQQLLELQRDAPEMGNRTARLLQYQSVRLEFSELLNELERIEQEWKVAENAVMETQAKLATLLPQLAAAQTAALLAKSEWEGRDNIDAQIKDCARWLEIRKAESLLLDLEDRLAKGTELLTQVGNDIRTTEEQIQKTDATIASNKAQMPDLALLGEVQIWFQQAAQFDRQIAESVQMITQGVAARAQIASEQVALALAKGIAVDADLAAGLRGQLAAQKAAASAARDHKERIAHQGGLETYALALVPGEACPLCGASHHPQPYDAGQAHAQLEAANAQIAEFEAQIVSLESTLQSAQALAVRLEEKDKQLTQLHATEQRQQDQRATHLQAFHWPQYQPDAPGKVEEDRQAALQFQSRIAKDEELRRALEQQLKKLQEDDKRYEAGLNVRREEKNRLLGQRDTHRQQLTVLLGELYETMANPEFERISKEKQTELARIDKALEASQKAEKALEIELAEWRQKQSAAASDRARLEIALEGARASFASKLSQSGFQHVDEVRAILAWKLDTAREQAAINQYKERKLTLETMLQTLETQSQSQQYDADAHASAEAAWLVAAQQIEDQQQALSLVRAAIVKLKADLERRILLETKQQALQKRQDNLRLMEGLFKASGFVKYVSTIYLQELVTRADLRFRKLTRNALSLELSEESDFLVRDMLNGGQTRSVKTLSGGQTFQASLCMALALADNVQQHSGSSHNFFFLDEGFGTLDKDSLTAVFDALKQLRQENRIVGVISHVEDMQQEIDVHLKVWQTEERGSLVQGSWE